MKKNFLPNCFKSIIPFVLCATINSNIHAQTITPVAINHYLGYTSSCSGSRYGDGGPATDACASYGYITAIATDTAGDVFIAEDRSTYFGSLGVITHEYRVRKINKATGYVLTIAGGGTGGDGVVGAAASIGYVQRMCADRAGNCFIVDEGAGAIRKIDAATGIISRVISVSSSTTYAPVGIYADTAGNILYGDRYWLKKYNLATHTNTIIAGSTAAGFSGDGGPATAARIFQPSTITGDAFGNIYFADNGSGRIRKITPAGIISTIGGGGTAFPEGCMATDARLRPLNISADSIGNIYLDDSDAMGFRKLDQGTGLINTVVLDSGSALSYNGAYGTPWWHTFGGSLHFAVGKNGSIYTTNTSGYTVALLSEANSPVGVLSVSDTLYTTCALPASLGFSVSGTLSTVPSTTDSATVTVNFGDWIGMFDYYSWDIVRYSDEYLRMAYGGTKRTYRLPYTLIGGTYQFGSASLLDTFTYRLPGKFAPVVTVFAGGKYYRYPLTKHLVGRTCTPAAYAPQGMAFTDSVVSPLCTFPKTFEFKYTAGIAIWDSIFYGISSFSYYPTSADSLYMLIDFGDSTHEVHSVPFTWSSGGICAAFGWDSGYLATMTVRHTYVTEGEYNPMVYFVTSDGRANLGDTYSWPTSPSYYPISIYRCDHGTLASNVVQTSSASRCTLPYSTSYSYSSWLSDSAAFTPTCQFYINLGDGFDTTFTDSVRYDPVTRRYGATGAFNHTYTMPGAYTAYFTDTAGSFTGGGLINYGTTPSELVLGTSCSAISGYFYIDSSGSCTRDAGERKLTHWPFSVTDNTTGTTNYYWCDDDGYYAISAISGHTYTIAADVSGRYGFTEATLTASCPATGIYTFTATGSSAISHDFAFACHLPSTMDMSVDAWGWGFIPGDTGFINVWSSNSWGFICDDSLSATITLIKDSRLSYAGMWAGPAPSRISGDTLTWNFISHDHLLDFNASVKVSTDTTLTITDTITNQVIVSPTRIADANMANNDYKWRTPVMTSFDPNEIQVSPKGFGDEGFIPNGTALSYLVHFQNTGNARARNITIVDTLDPHLDLSTLQVIGATAPVQVYNVQGNIVKFRFNNIYLPDSNSNVDSSNGFVSFNIVPFDSLASGTRIKNSVGIYFDYNPAVYTNTTLNTIEDTIGAIYGPDSVCVGAAIRLTNHISGGTWSGGNGHANVSGGIVSGLTPGMARITYTAYGHLTVEKIVYVQAAPEAVTLAGAHELCMQSTATLTPSISGGVWQSATNHASVSNGVVTAVTSGADTILYSIRNSCGTTTASQAIYVQPLPDAGVLNGVGAICEGTSASLTASVPGGTWNSSNANITVADGTYTAIAAGNAQVIYRVANECGTAEALLDVLIMPLANAGSINGADSVCVNSQITLSNAITGGTWSSKNPTFLDVSGNGTVTGMAAGTTAVAYSVTNNCGTRSVEKSISVLSGGDCEHTNSAIIRQVAIFPNPANSSFTLRVPAHKEELTIVLVNVHGQTVLSKLVSDNKMQEIPVYVGQLPSGIYLVKTNVDGIAYELKMVIM